MSEVAEKGRMRKSRKWRVIILAAFVFILSSPVLLVFLHWATRDAFFPFELICSCPKREYKIGEVIEIDYEIHCLKGVGKIRLYKDRAKSLSLFLRAGNGKSVDFSDTDFYSHSGEATEDDIIDTFKVKSNKPFKMRVTGSIQREDNSDKLVFDFPGFGRFVKNGPGWFLVGGYWRPIRPDLGDSLEDFTNKVWIHVSDEKGDSAGVYQEE